MHHSALGFGDGVAPLDLPLPFLVGREGTRAGLRSRLDPLCRGVAGRGGAGTHRFSCASARTRHHPGTIAALEGRIWLPRACDQPTKALGHSPYEGLG